MINRLTAHPNARPTTGRREMRKILSRAPRSSGFYIQVDYFGAPLSVVWGPVDGQPLRQMAILRRLILDTPHEEKDRHLSYRTPMGRMGRTRNIWMGSWRPRRPLLQLIPYAWGNGAARMGDADPGERHIANGAVFDVSPAAVRSGGILEAPLAIPACYQTNHWPKTR